MNSASISIDFSKHSAESFSKNNTWSRLIGQRLPINQNARDICHLEALVIVLVTFEAQLNEHQLWVLYEYLTAAFDFVGQSFGSMVDGGDTEVVLVIHEKEAERNVALFVQLVHDFGADHDTWVLAVLEH